MESKPARKARAAAIQAELVRLYPTPVCALASGGPFELLVATILSAQCTDVRVNMVTPALFARFPDAPSMAAADVAEVEGLVHTTGFFRNKAKNIVNMAKALMDRHDGRVPATMDELHPLPGVGRKTANVVLGECFDTPGLTVDTHMQRVNRRLGLIREEDPVKIERELMELVPQPDWRLYSLRIITHGRALCDARRPLCGECALAPLCPHYAKTGGEPGAGGPPVKRARPGKPRPA